MDRLSNKDDLAFQEYVKCFDHAIYRFTIVVFTYLDQCQSDMEDAGKIPDPKLYMEILPMFAKNFIKNCSDGRFCVSNRCTEDDMDTQVRSWQSYTEEMLSKVIVKEKRDQIWSRIFNRNNLEILAIGIALATVYKRVLR